jgi:hypothetical protein
MGGVALKPFPTTAIKAVLLYLVFIIGKAFAARLVMK